MIKVVGLILVFLIAFGATRHFVHQESYFADKRVVAPKGSPFQFQVVNDVKLRLNEHFALFGAKPLKLEDAGLSDLAKANSQVKELFLSKDGLYLQFSGESSAAKVAFYLRGERWRCSSNRTALGCDVVRLIPRPHSQLAGKEVATVNSLSKAKLGNGEEVGNQRCQGEVVVLRQSFSSQIKNREPLRRIYAAGRDAKKIYFYNEIFVKGRSHFKHSWYFDGKKAATIPFDASRQSWRTWSSKQIDHLQKATNIRVEVTDANDCVVSEAFLSFHPNIPTVHQFFSTNLWNERLPFDLLNKRFDEVLDTKLVSDVESLALGTESHQSVTSQQHKGESEKLDLSLPHKRFKESSAIDVEDEIRALFRRDSTIPPEYFFFRNSEGETPLDILVSRGNKQLIRSFIYSLKRSNMAMNNILYGSPLALSEKNADGDELLIQAIRYGDEQFVFSLLEGHRLGLLNGVELSWKAASTGQTPVELAADTGYPGIHYLINSLQPEYRPGRYVTRHVITDEVVGGHPKSCVKRINTKYEQEPIYYFFELAGFEGESVTVKFSASYNDVSKTIERRVPIDEKLVRLQEEVPEELYSLRGVRAELLYNGKVIAHNSLSTDKNNSKKIQRREIDRCQDHRDLVEHVRNGDRYIIDFVKNKVDKKYLLSRPRLASELVVASIDSNAVLLLDKLLGYGIDLNLHKSRKTPSGSLYYAIRRNKPRMAEMLLSHGIRPIYRRSDGSESLSPLFSAIAYDSTAILPTLAISPYYLGVDHGDLSGIMQKALNSCNKQKVYNLIVYFPYSYEPEIMMRANKCWGEDVASKLLGLLSALSSG